jgi:hypothetical protein
MNNHAVTTTRCEAFAWKTVVWRQGFTMTKCETAYPALIEPFIDGELSGSARNALLDHLMLCVICRNALDQAHTLSRIVRRSRPEVRVSSALRQG